MLITTTEGISLIRPVTSKLKHILFLISGGSHTLGCSQDETSEQFIGEWAEKRGIRDQLVIATKVGVQSHVLLLQIHLHPSLVFHELQTRRPKHKNSSKLCRQPSQEYATQRRGQFEEVADNIHRRSLRALVGIRHFDRGGNEWPAYFGVSEQGSIFGMFLLLAEVHFLWLTSLQGASNVPAWVVATANQYARDHGKTPFSVYQGSWSIMERSFERDIIPMARKEGTRLIFSIPKVILT